MIGIAGVVVGRYDGTMECMAGTRNDDERLRMRKVGMGMDME